VNFLSDNLQTADFESLSSDFRVLPSIIKKPITNSQELIDFEYYSNQITGVYFQNIKNHLDDFSSFGSRVTGYPGYEHAINYIQDFFMSQNLTEVQTLSYPLVIPLDRSTKITINEENVTAHALVPNSANACKTPSGGVSGTLVYGGSGIYTDLDGKKIEGSIVALEFNSKDNWIKVASLGAKAVIYLQPEDTNRFEAEAKSTNIPLEFPRIYISNKTTIETIRQLSFQSNQSITIYSDVDWISIEAKNVMGLLPGLDDDIIIISAYFDSASVVPSIAPGTDEACGIATLLELIRIMKDNTIIPQKTIMFLALSGHNQAAAGAREFVFQNYDVLNIDGGIKLFLSLDLSASNTKIGVNPYGYLYKFKLKFTLGNNLFARLKNIGEDLLINYGSSIREVTGYSFDVESYIYLEEFEKIAPIRFVGDQEPFISSNVLGLSLYTAESDRSRFNTPFDLPEYLQLDKLKSQVVYSLCALVQLVNEEKIGNYLDLAHEDFSLKQATHVGFGNIEGYCKEYNETTAWINNVADTLIRVTSSDPNTGSPGIYPYYAKTSEDGYYQVRGVSSSQPNNPLEFHVEAYSFDCEGKLIKANNMGSLGQFFKQSNKLINRDIKINPTVFDCGTIGFFNTSYPFEQVSSFQFLNYQVLDPETRTSLLSYGYIGFESASLVFLPPRTPSVLIGTFTDKSLDVYATNSSSESLRGNGFQVLEGEFNNLGISAFITLRDLQSITRDYIEFYNSFNIYDDQVNNTFQTASKLISSANQLEKNDKHSEAILTISEAKIWSDSALKQAQNVIAGSMTTALLFAFLIIPFSFALSWLLFNIDSGFKWILATSLIYALTFSFFYFIHPGFQVAPHLGLTLIGIINFISVFPVIYMLGNEGQNFLKSLRKSNLGSHFIDKDTSSAILIAISTGISRMKKHKIRSLISLSSISLLTFSLTLFTSTSALVEENFFEFGIPIVIAILLMINTSISTVHESKKEITTFTLVGLTPTQVIGLFLTEFLVHAVIGSVIGYFGGITFIRLLSTIGLISGSLAINYSTGAVITSLTLSAVGLLLSIMYPLQMSARMSVPSRKRTWELTTSPEEDGTNWNIPLPFITATEEEAEGIIEFLQEFFMIYKSDSVGGTFFVRDIFVKGIRGKEKHLIATVNLAPFDMGIKQTMDLGIYFDKSREHWVFEIKLVRLEGVLLAWEASVKRFIGDIRNQLLIWKILPTKEKTAMIEQFREELKKIR
jgi:hypothetical protein